MASPSPTRSLGRQWTPRSAPDYVAPLSQVRADADGNLWIQETQSVRGTNPVNPFAADVAPIFDVVNRAGVMIDRIQIPGAAFVVGFGPHVVYLISKSRLWVSAGSGTDPIAQHPSDQGFPSAPGALRDFGIGTFAEQLRSEPLALRDALDFNRHGIDRPLETSQRSSDPESCPGSGSKCRGRFTIVATTLMSVHEAIPMQARPAKNSSGCMRRGRGRR